MRHRRLLIAAVIIAPSLFLLLTATVGNADRTPQSETSQAQPDPPVDVASAGSAFDCGYQKSGEAFEKFIEGIERGEYPDPELKGAMPKPPAIRTGQKGISALSDADLFIFEDGSNLLQSNFSDGALFNLMTQAANAVIAEHGDQFDYFAFFVSANPNHQIGAAFYLPIFNDVAGIGDGFFNFRNAYGLNSNVAYGYVMMWEVNDWQPGSGGPAGFTRLVLAQEFEHRWAMFLNPINGGRAMQGDDAGCGRSAHWSFRVDGQGSGMEIREWTGTNPATRVPGTLTFNTDIPGGVFSYTDLYLMGYVSPAEMDAGNSELRFMDNSCSSPYVGPIFNMNSAHIVATNGQRIPNSTDAQKDFRCAWTMIHPNNQPPSQAQIDRALDIMDQQQLDWNYSTLERGTLDNSLIAGSFSGTPLMGPAPLTVDFTFDSLYETYSWDWDFGDGDVDTIPNPQHTFGPGLYDVELEIDTELGTRFVIKRNYVTAWADTVDPADMTVPYDTGSFYWEIHATNGVPIEEFVIPVSLTNVPAVIKLDSVSRVGTRTEYFELKQNVFNNALFGQLAVLLRADNGGGSVPLPPGSGPIARIWMTTKPAALPGDTIALTFAPLEGIALEHQTITTSFEPVSYPAVVTLTGPPCGCDCHADPLCDLVTNVFDVVKAVDVGFRSVPPEPDPNPLCSRQTTDINCDDVTNVFDVVGLVDVAFRSGDPETVFCDPCAL